MFKITKITASFFIVLFVSYYGSAVLFSHTHIINGATIVHSHFHTDSHHDTTSGGHTEHCITLIAQISHFDYIDFLCKFVLIPQQITLYKSKFVEVIHWETSQYFKNTSLRAPPILI